MLRHVRVERFAQNFGQARRQRLANLDQFRLDLVANQRHARRKSGDFKNREIFGRKSAKRRLWAFYALQRRSRALRHSPRLLRSCCFIPPPDFAPLVSPSSTMLRLTDGLAPPRYLAPALLGFASPAAATNSSQASATRPSSKSPLCA